MIDIEVKAETPAVLEWVRPPQQARTRAALNRMLDATEEILAEKSFEEATIAEIARRAESSVGGFYRRFRDKEGLLHALHERFCEEARATSDHALDVERWKGASVREIATAFTAFLAKIYSDREGMLRVFLVQSSHDVTVQERHARLFLYIASGMERLLEERSDEITHPEPEIAASFGLHMILGTLDQVLQVQADILPFGSDRIAGELARALCAYLGAADTELDKARIKKTKQRRHP